MKKRLVCLVLMLLVLVSAVYAADFDMTIDDKPLGKYLDIYPGKNIKITYIVEAGVRLIDVDLECTNEAICAFMKDQLHLFDSTTVYESSHSDDRYVYIHDRMPAGDYDIMITVTYDNDGEQKEFTHDLAVEVKSNSLSSSLFGIATSWLSEGLTYELINKFQTPKIKRLNKEIIPRDLKGIDLASIGLTDDDIDNENYVLEEIGVKESEEFEISTSQAADIFNMVGGLIPELEKNYAKFDKPIVKKSYKKFRITNPDNNKEMILTKVMVSVFSRGGMNNLNVVEVIPKTWAEDSSDVYFVMGPKILEADPVVMWDFSNLPSGKTKDYAYVLSKDINSIESTSMALGHNASWFAKFFRFCLYGGWMIVIPIVLVLVVGTPIFVKARKHRNKKVGKFA
ncbi:hypothetical protein HOB76_01775 [Candidatus Woesearchaeota archaeon]|nr:hypothetical protein [Candidatus Woesearchaeota archaeon]